MLFSRGWLSKSAAAGLVAFFPILTWLVPDAVTPVATRFVEGTVHGFLILTTVDGKTIASGDLRQTRKAKAVQSQTKFRFKDGSLWEESVVFTQQRVFSLQSYRLLQRGPAFNEDVEISLEHSGQYHVKTRDHKTNQEKILDGTIDLPADVYNGLIFTVAKNISSKAGQSVHIVAFTPEPRVIELEIIPTGQQTVMIGGNARTAIHYVLHPNLGFWLKLFATLSGPKPTDANVWILADPIPAFVRFEGSLFTSGPVWRIELTSPRWPQSPQ
jgi:hypothetical protein